MRRGPLHELQALYAGRIVPPVTIIELEEKRRLPPAALKVREAELILGALPAGARLVALDEAGATWTSRDFADRLASWRDSGTAALDIITSAARIDMMLIDIAMPEIGGTEVAREALAAHPHASPALGHRPTCVFHTR